jgi:hypothetical protein
MKRLLYILFILFFTIVRSQESRSIIGRSYLFVGQQTSLTYMVKMNTTSKYSYKPYKKTISADLLKSNGEKSKAKVGLEIIQSFHDTIVKTKAKEKMWIGSYTIAVWDSGYIEIPKSSILVDGKEITLSSVVIKADLVAKKKGIDIYDIKENYTDVPAETVLEKVKKLIKNYWGWLFLLIPLVLFIIYKFKNKQKVQVEDLIISLTPKEIALAAISELEAQRLWEKGKLKTHYIELSHILRGYLSDILQIHLLEKTTSETKLLLEQKGIKMDLIAKIEDVLQQSDMVKFAKSTPDEITILSVSIIAKEIIQEINSSQKPHVE